MRERFTLEPKITQPLLDAYDRVKKADPAFIERLERGDTDETESSNTVCHLDDLTEREQKLVDLVFKAALSVCEHNGGDGPGDEWTKAEICEFVQAVLSEHGFDVPVPAIEIT